MIGIIYKYTNKINNKVYIGQTLHEEERKKAHFTSYANNKFHKAIHYYGWINFDYEVIETVEQSKLSERELYWIKYYDSVNNGYNTKSSSCVAALEQKIILKQHNKYHYVRLPFGYEHRNKDGKIYINEQQADIIRNIFNDYISGCSIKDINNKYNIDYRVLKNEKYKGNEVFPQIISDEIFDKVQELIKTSKHKSHRTNKVIIDGIEYPSIMSAAKATGIDRRRIKKYYI